MLSNQEVRWAMMHSAFWLGITAVSHGFIHNAWHAVISLRGGYTREQPDDWRTHTASWA